MKGQLGESSMGGQCAMSHRKKYLASTSWQLFGAKVRYMSTSSGNGQDQQLQPGFEAALLELRHQALHLEARGAHRAAVTLYDAIRIARLGGLRCQEHAPPR